jgi:hypothetical protein
MIMRHKSQAQRDDHGMVVATVADTGLVALYTVQAGKQQLVSHCDSIAAVLACVARQASLGVIHHC